MAPRIGLNGIRTSLRQHVHSLPPSHRSADLERHLLAKEKERLDNEIARLERRCCQCRQWAADIEARLAVTPGRARSRLRTPSPPGSDHSDEHPFRYMAVDY